MVTIYLSLKTCSRGQFADVPAMCCNSTGALNSSPPLEEKRFYIQFCNLSGSSTDHISTVVSKSGLTIRMHKCRDLTSQKSGGYGEADLNRTSGMTASLPLYRLCCLEPADTSTGHNLFSCWTRPRARWYKIKSKWVIWSWTVVFKKMWLVHRVFKSLKNNFSRNAGQVLMNTDVTLHENSHPMFWEAQGHFLFIHRDICCQASDYRAEPTL